MNPYTKIATDNFNQVGNKLPFTLGGVKAILFTFLSKIQGAALRLSPFTTIRGDNLSAAPCTYMRVCTASEILKCQSVFL